MSAFVPIPSTPKTIYLIRHAQSVNNVSKATFTSTIMSGRRPQGSEWGEIGALLKVKMDTPLSEKGHGQANALRDVLAGSSFLQDNNVELIVHSPLQRAKITCYTLFANSSEGRIPILEHEQIYERSIMEHIAQETIVPRIRSFETWLQARPESIIVVVGHSSFFLKMAGVKMGNTSVWRGTLEGGGWRGVEMLHGTPE